jgi:signal transduction histidine kinase/ligand-binding sensor domain-containing protein/AraC-like DNA-binding protein/CheY-like chemotaxis protein
MEITPSKNIFRATWLSSLLLALTALPTFAQSPRLYSPAQGLINTRVSNLAFDSENFLWVSTEMGLARFNGRDFTTYFASDDDPYSLHSSGVNCVFEDPAGRHWVGTKDGLYYFCRTENKFTHYDLSPDSTITVSISAIVSHPTRHNYLLVSTYGYGIYAFDTERREVDLDMSVALSIQLDKYNLSTIFVDRRKQLWALLRESVNVVDLTGEPRRVELQMTPAVEADVMHEASYALIEDPKRPLVYFGGVHGLFVADEKSLTVTRVRGTEHLNIRALRFDAEDNLLIGTENQGLYTYNFEAQEPRRMNFANCPCDLDHSKIHNIVFDNEHNLWLGLFQQGVMIVPARTDLFRYYSVSNMTDGCNLACVSSFAAMGLKHGLIGTDGGGLLEYNDGKVSLYTTANSALRTDAIISLAATGEEEAYVGTFNEGLYLCSGGKVTRPEALESLAHTSVMCQVYDRSTHLLYIGTNGHGIFAYDTQRHTLRSLGTAGAFNPWIVALGLDEGKTLWVATEEHTLSIDLADETVSVIDGDLRQKMRVLGIVPDANCVWIAGNKGLWRYDRISRRLTAVRQESMRRGEVITSLARGNDGNLWMATNLGIVAYNPTTDEVLHYGGEELTLVGSFCERAVASDLEGRMYFGGDNGLLLFNPLSVTSQNAPLREAFFTSLWVNNVLTDYNPAAERNVLDASLWHAKRLTLRPDENSFTISFAVQEYGNPSAIRYAYRLEGYDDTWTEVPYGSNNTVNFTRLPWGTYHLQVRAYTHEGQMNNASFKQLTVVILTPWYARWWAWLIYLVLLAALVQVVVYYFRQRAHQKRLLLRTEHKQQIKEAKLQLFTSISHEIKTPLTLILSPLRSLMDKKVDNATASVYELMYRNAMRILMLVNQQMDVRKIDNGKLKLKMRPLVVRQFLTDIMDYYNHAAMSHQIMYQLEMPSELDDLALWGDPDQLDKVYFNLLSNAFKYTPNHGRVRVMVRRLPNTILTEDKRISEVLEVSVFNSGSSLTSSDIEHIFERFYQGKNQPECVGSGIGLNLAYELTLLHHGLITARNVDGEGVEFTVTLPLGKEHLSPEELAPTEPLNNPLTGNQMSDLVQTKKAMMTADSGETLNEEVVPAETEEAATAEEDRSPVTVLLVDDDASFLDYVRGELKEYHVVTANSGNDAWGQLLVSAPDVVVTDVKMPNGDGYELCHRIKRNIDTENIPVIVLTSESTQQSAEQAMECEADRFLSKPLNVTLLRGAIEQSLKVRRNILSRARRSDVGFEYNQVQMESADSKLMQHVMDSIRRHLSDSDFNVEQLSREVGISRVHLNRKMKELLGTSPSTLIRSVRLKQAAFLLIDNDVTVSEIAYSVGFSSPSYFTSNFTSYFGMTPKAFVQNYLKNPNDEKLKKLLE